MRASGDPGALHAAALLAAPVARRLRWCEATSTALVLGRAQRSPPERELALVRRSSGGGAVLVAPGDPVWADLIIPNGDPLWEDDVGRAAWWVGEAWAAALSEVGVPSGSLTVHRGGKVRRPYGDEICFAGLADGEVCVEGAKVVGVAQRRTRAGALFQCAALMRWEPRPLLAALGVEDDRRGGHQLDHVAVGLRDLVPGVHVAAVEAALEAALPG